ncbi:hypothetical protein Hanom_Chr01g00030381 [Helianthus anomalus]
MVEIYFVRLSTRIRIMYESCGVAPRVYVQFWRRTDKCIYKCLPKVKMF